MYTLVRFTVALSPLTCERRLLPVRRMVPDWFYFSESAEAAEMVVVMVVVVGETVGLLTCRWDGPG